MTGPLKVRSVEFTPTPSSTGGHRWLAKPTKVKQLILRLALRCVLWYPNSAFGGPSCHRGG
jgi:hypothetical protein